MSTTIVTTQVWENQMQSQTVVEVTADEGAVLDRGWREKWSAEARKAMADSCSTSSTRCSARVATERAGVFVELAAELSRAGQE
jgi:hypothetical protein